MPTQTQGIETRFVTSCLRGADGTPPAATWNALAVGAAGACVAVVPSSPRSNHGCGMCVFEQVGCEEYTAEERRWRRGQHALCGCDNNIYATRPGHSFRQAPARAELLDAFPALHAPAAPPFLVHVMPRARRLCAHRSCLCHWTLCSFSHSRGVVSGLSLCCRRIVRVGAEEEEEIG